MNPWPKNVALKILCGIWSFPLMVITMLFVFLPLWIARQVKPVGWSEGAWDIRIEQGTWVYRKTPNWRAFSVAWLVFYRGQENLADAQVRIHERAHTRQQLILGVLDWILYALISLVIWTSCRNLHAYAANPFELDARVAAKQDISKITPKDGDRWPWW